MSETQDYTIYVLRCCSEKYYVGKTRRDLDIRFNEHLNGVGSSWTKKYRPLYVVGDKKGDGYEEGAMTLRMMEKYGIPNVRGGPYCSEELTNGQLTEITRQICSSSDRCYKCQLRGHFASKCSSEVLISNTNLREPQIDIKQKPLIPDITNLLLQNNPQIDIKQQALIPDITKIINSSTGYNSSFTTAVQQDKHLPKEDLGMFSFGNFKIHFDNDRKAIYDLDKPVSTAVGNGINLAELHILGPIPSRKPKIKRFKALELITSSSENMLFSPDKSKIYSRLPRSPLL